MKIFKKNTLIYFLTNPKQYAQGETAINLLSIKSSDKVLDCKWHAAK